MSFKKIGFVRRSNKTNWKIFSLMNESTQLDNQMKSFFLERTKKHIALVQEFIDKASQYYPDYSDIIQQRGVDHDKSKFKNPEYEPYVHLTWHYKCKGENKTYEMDEDIQEACHDMSFHHCKNNKHHPEYWDNNLKVNPINFKDREKPSGVIIDATMMDTPSMIEMVCDWCAIYSENYSKNTCKTPKEWADKNIGPRWKFSSNQKDLIYNTIQKLV